MPKARKDRWAARHDSQKVDLVFIVDCTGSMGVYISQVQRNISIISETISRTAFDVHLGLVTYRDHPPQEITYVVKSHDFTADLNEMKANVSAMSASGGGDCPEAVADGINAMLKLSFRPDATKVAVLICDAPPHGLTLQGDLISDGCPEGHDPVRLCHQLAKKEITLYCAGCEPALNEYRDFFIALAHITGGTYVPIIKSHLLSKIIINGCLQEISSEKLMGHVNDYVQLTMSNLGTAASIDSLADKLHNYLNMTNNVVERLQVDGKEVDIITDLARKLSRLSTLEEVRDIWRNEHPEEPETYQDQSQNEVTLSSLQPVTRLHAERLLHRCISRGGYAIEHSMDDECNVKLCPVEA